MDNTEHGSVTEYVDAEARKDNDAVPFGKPHPFDVRMVKRGNDAARKAYVECLPDVSHKGVRDAEAG